MSDGTVCPECGSKRVATGAIAAGRGGVWFEPEGLRFLPELAAMFTRVFRIHGTSRACIDCGLLWNRLDPLELRERLREGGTVETRVRLVLDVDEDHPAVAALRKREGGDSPGAG